MPVVIQDGILLYVLMFLYVFPACLRAFSISNLTKVIKIQKACQDPTLHGFLLYKLAASTELQANFDEEVSGHRQDHNQKICQWLNMGILLGEVFF